MLVCYLSKIKSNFSVSSGSEIFKRSTSYLFTNIYIGLWCILLSFEFHSRRVLLLYRYDVRLITQEGLNIRDLFCRPGSV